MTLLADTGTQTSAMPRAEAYTRAGEQWLLADDPAAAANGFMRALEDGGPAVVDPRAPLARALFMMGRAEEAEALISRLAAEPPREPRICDLMAELLVERTDLIGALAWAGAGVELCLGRIARPGRHGRRCGHRASRKRARTASGHQPSAGWRRCRPRDRAELRLLLTLRFRIRNDLGLPEDDYDRLLDELPSGPGTISGSL